MKCPVCSVDLHIADRAGIEIDFCPKCRGVWLDRGELDKILERSVARAPHRADEEEHDEHDFDDRAGKRDSRGGSHPPAQQHPKKKGSFLSELFDFG